MSATATQTPVLTPIPEDELVKFTNPPVAMKRCKCCGKLKTYAEFTRNRSNPDGFADYCRECRKAKRALRAQTVNPQPGRKMTLCLADFKDEELFAELRRRNWSGDITKIEHATI